MYGNFDFELFSNKVDNTFLTMNTSPIITFDHVAVSFGKTTVHRDINFTIAPGEVVTILGPSGSGKTMILKMLIGLLRPTSGSVVVMNHPMHTLDGAELEEARHNIGMLFQGAALFDSLSVFENVAYSLREERRWSEAEIADRVAETLNIVGLPGIEQKFPTQLSGGQKKRVGLARALARSPKIMLFDEPTTGLDPTATRLIDELIMKLRADFGMTSVVVTHDIRSAQRVSDRWLLINEGRVAANGRSAELLDNNKLVIDFTSGHWRAEETVSL